MNFQETQKLHQIDWWKTYSNQPNWEEEKSKWGRWGRIQYSHIVKGNWNVLLWQGIQKELPLYLGTEIQPHSGVNNLLSSWVASANLYFPAYFHNEFQKLLLGFLQKKVSGNIIEIIGIELEYALDGELNPKELLGEMDGSRGSGQTSPDVAFIIKTTEGEGLILTECKYTEHSFYKCSARRSTDRGDKPKNPDSKKCLQAASNCDYKSIPCHQHVWKRKYFDHFDISAFGKQQLKRCPAATAGYQLMRQQSLANGIYKSGKYDMVVSSVSFDGRNTDLINSLNTTGINDFQTDWSKIYNQGADFITWHHQDWVDYVRAHSKAPLCLDWLKYMKERYGY